MMRFYGTSPHSARQKAKIMAGSGLPNFVVRDRTGRKGVRAFLSAIQS
jgi:hypothetical protein